VTEGVAGDEAGGLQLTESLQGAGAAHPYSAGDGVGPGGTRLAQGKEDGPAVRVVGRVAIAVNRRSANLVGRVAIAVNRRGPVWATAWQVGPPPAGSARLRI
jgi:hypothetical protein